MSSKNWQPTEAAGWEKKMKMVKQKRTKEPKEKFSSYTRRKIRRAKPA